MEDDGLAGELGGVVLGESDVDVLLLTGLHADDLILEAGDKAAGAELEVEVLTLAALEGNAVVEALKVDVGGVALLGGAIDAHETAVAVGHLLQAGVDVRGHDLDLGLGGLKALVLAELDLGIDGDGALEHDALLAAGIQLHLGIADDLQLLLLHGALVGVGQNDIHGLLIEHLGAVHALDHLAGSLAGAEAGHVDLAAHLEICLVQGGLKILGADLDGQQDLAVFQFFTGFDTHFVFSSVQHHFIFDCQEGIPGKKSRSALVNRRFSMQFNMITENSFNFHTFLCPDQFFLEQTADSPLRQGKSPFRSTAPRWRGDGIGRADARNSTASPCIHAADAESPGSSTPDRAADSAGSTESPCPPPA